METNGKIIVAVDFDGILCRDQYPEIGDPNYAMISFIRELQDNENIDTILWTSRVNKRCMNAFLWCVDYGLKFTCVNECTLANMIEFGHDTRKVYADIYIDDKNVHFLWLKQHFGYETALSRTIDNTKSYIKSLLAERKINNDKR